MMYPIQGVAIIDGKMKHRRNSRVLLPKLSLRNRYQAFAAVLEALIAIISFAKRSSTEQQDREIPPEL